MKQAMYCHYCDRDFSVDINMKANGNHVFKCPYCSHEHCRVVKDGVVTSDRWDARNGKRGMVYTAIASPSTVYIDDSTTGGYFLDNSWGSTSTATAYY